MKEIEIGSNLSITITLCALVTCICFCVNSCPKIIEANTKSSVHKVEEVNGDNP